MNVNSQSQSQSIQTKAQLYKISNSTLLDEVKSLVGREKALTAQVIEYLKEIDSRNLFLECGYPSLFAFAVGFLGYSEAESQIRISAARLSHALPEVPALVEAGKLSLSVVAAAQSSFRKENQKRKEEDKPLLSIQEKHMVLAELEGAGRRKAEQILAVKFDDPKSRSITIEISEELQSKIDQLLDLMAHKNFDRNLAKMLEILVEQELAKYERKLGASINDQGGADTQVETDRQHQVKQKNGAIHLAQQCESNQMTSQTEGLDTKEQIKLFGASKATNPEKTRSIDGNSVIIKNKSRYIPQATRRLVWAKHKGKCTYQDPRTGKQCGSTHGIQIDHERAFSKGGTNEPNNLKLLCASHNSWKGAW